MSLPLGQFEQLVLTAVLSLGESAYGVTIHAKVEELSRPRRISRGAVYATLERMEEQHFLTSWLSEPVAQRGGRPRRHYRLQKAGEQALKDAARTGLRMYEIVAQSLGGVPWMRPT